MGARRTDNELKAPKRGDSTVVRAHRFGHAYCCVGARNGHSAVRVRTTHAQPEGRMETIKQGTDTLFILLGAIMVLAMHAGFAFLELGTVRKKNQVNALVKILVDFAVSTIAYFFVGYARRLRHPLLRRRRDAGGQERLRAGQVLLPADLCRGHPGHRLRRHRRACALRPAAAGHRRCWSALVYPLFEGMVWDGRFGMQAWIKGLTGADFHDFAGSVVVHAVGGWIGLAAVLLLGARSNRYRKDGAHQRAPAVEHPLPGAGLVGADGGLVRLQRDERADHRQDLRPGGGELADGHGRRHAGGHAAGPQRPGLRLQRPAGRAGGGVRRLRRDAPAGRAGHRRRGRRDLRRACSR